MTMTKSSFRSEVGAQMSPSTEPQDAKDQAIAALTSWVNELEARMEKPDGAITLK